MILFDFKKVFRRQIMYSGIVEYLRLLLRGGASLRLPACPEMEIKPTDVLIDCGANVGDISSLFARTGARVYAFEPHPVCWKILDRRFRKMANVKCLNAGVMDRDSFLELQIPGVHATFDEIDVSVGASFFSGTMWPGKHTITEIEVRCIDLDRFIRDLGGRVSVLKLDIEGAEVAVLNRLLDTGTIELIDFVIAETHDRMRVDLVDSTNALRRRIEAAGLQEKIRLDWH